MIQPCIGRLVCDDPQVVVAERLHEANTFWTRFVGLQFHRPLKKGEALLLRNCRSLHTFWMRFPIDVLFLDESLVIIEIRRRIRPFRTVIPKVPKARHAVEFCSEEGPTIEIGNRLRILP